MIQIRYNQLYSPTDAHGKIEVTLESQKTPTCFGIEVPSSGSYIYRGV
jgi:hypothetical protein